VLSDDCQIPSFTEFQCDCAEKAKVFSRQCPICATDCDNFFREYDNIYPCDFLCNNTNGTVPLHNGNCDIPLFNSYSCGCNQNQPFKVFTRNCPLYSYSFECQDTYDEYELVAPCDNACVTEMTDECYVRPFQNFECECQSGRPAKEKIADRLFGDIQFKATWTWPKSPGNSERLKLNELAFKSSVKAPPYHKFGNHMRFSNAHVPPVKETVCRNLQPLSKLDHAVMFVGIQV